MDSEAGPSSQPLRDGGSSDLEPENGAAGPQRSPLDDETSESKGKGREVDRDSIQIIELETGPPSRTSTPLTGHALLLSPLPSPLASASGIKFDKLPARKRIPSVDSSNIDSVSYAHLPTGKPLESPALDPPPPAKRFRPLGPTPLPTGPPTVNTLRILLEPEHIDRNQPKQFFDYLRKRDDAPPRVQLGPLEIKEILEKMRRVNQIWLTTMGEDEGNVSVITGWLREFIGNKNPKSYEGVVSPAIWVILKAKPPFKVLKTSRISLYAKQCLEKAKTQKSAKTDDVEKAVNNLEHLIDLQKKNGVGGGSSSATPAPEPGSTGVPGSRSGPSASVAGLTQRTLPNFKKTNSFGESSNMPINLAGPSGSGANLPARPPPAIPQLTDLQKLLATVSSFQKPQPASNPTNHPGQAGPSRPPHPPPPMTRPKIEVKTEPGDPISYRPRPSHLSGNMASASSSAFMPAPAPTPLTIKREPGLVKLEPGTVKREPGVGSSSMSNNDYPRVSTSGPSSVPISASGSGSRSDASYPSVTNRWSSLATPAVANRPYTAEDYKKRPNWRNCKIRYRDNDLAEARLFEQEEGEEEFDPYWWKYGKHGDQGPSGAGLDKEEGLTMRHVHGHEPAIEWYDPLVYDLQAPADRPLGPALTGPVVTPESQLQDQRERPILSAYYRNQLDIPLCPDESNVRFALPHENYGTIQIPPMPRAYIPRPPQPLMYPPQGGMYGQQPPQPAYGNAYRPRDAPPQTLPNSNATSPAFRPRNPPPANTGMSPAYRPRDRANSAPTLGPPPQQQEEMRRASTPGPGGVAAPPKIKSTLPPSGNLPPTLDREGTIRMWRREMRPQRSALLNPLSAQEVAANLAHINNVEPMKYEHLNVGEDHEGGYPGQPGPTS